jgi:hypothetical protein
MLTHQAMYLLLQCRVELCDVISVRVLQLRQLA